MSNVEQQSGWDNVYSAKSALRTNVSSREYFLSLLPALSDDFVDKIEHPDFKDLSPNIRFPFHVTLYYLGKLSSDELKLVAEWLSQKETIKSPIRAKVSSVSSFKKDGEDVVYFLDLSSEKIDELNSELLESFPHLRRDAFAFSAHMTLFYPTKKITKSQRERLSSLFSDVSEIHFNQLALGSVVDEKIEINQLVSLS